MLNEKSFHLEAEMRLTEKNLLAGLKRHGYKLTPQRRAVVRVLTSTRDHLSPAAVYEKLHRDYPGIGLVTIYRTLELLTGLGLTCELHTDGKCSYTAGAPQHHHHLICSGCGTVVDFPGRHLERLEKSLSMESGFRIDSHLLEFIGLCRNCQKITSL
jgi:Fur family ferric uptake transcriptional regulator